MLICGEELVVLCHEHRQVWRTHVRGWQPVLLRITREPLMHAGWLHSEQTDALLCGGRCQRHNVALPVPYAHFSRPRDTAISHRPPREAECRPDPDAEN